MGNTRFVFEIGDLVEIRKKYKKNKIISARFAKLVRLSEERNAAGLFTYSLLKSYTLKNENQKIKLFESDLLNKKPSNVTFLFSVGQKIRIKNLNMCGDVVSFSVKLIRKSANNYFLEKKYCISKDDGKISYFFESELENIDKPTPKIDKTVDFAFSVGGQIGEISEKYLVVEKRIVHKFISRGSIEPTIEKGYLLENKGDLFYFQEKQIKIAS